MKRGIAHIEIPAANRKESAAFYNDLFGWDAEHFEDLQYSLFETGNIGGGYTDINANFPADRVMVYIESEDLNADLERIEQAGGQTVTPATDVPGFGSFAMFKDPAGNTLALWKSASQ